MINSIRQYLEGKTILILGYGREGHSSYNFIRRYLPDAQIGIADKVEIDFDINLDLKNDKNTKLYFGDDYLESILQYDVILKSPGISLKTLNVSVFKDKLTSQSDLFLKFAKNKTIGITGTKGKSTTSSLIYHILKGHDDNVRLVGNIGIPPFEILEEIDDDTTIIFELSSHQLEYINHSPYISLLLNIFEEHLDHYKSFLEYQLAKLNIYKFQGCEDYIIYNGDNKIVTMFVDNSDVKNNKIRVTCDKEKTTQNCIYLDSDEVLFSKDGYTEKVYDVNQINNLIGRHNLYNIMFAISACKLLGLNNDEICQGIGSFSGLPHRIEYVGCFDGIHFYNDSIATIPEATISAVESLENIDTIILGGLDRGVSYKEFAEYLAESHIQNLILMPDTGNLIYEHLQNMNSEKVERHSIHFARDIQNAVEIAKKVTEKGKICLFSPAAASYGFFKNFEERGNIFKDLVKAN